MNRQLLPLLLGLPLLAWAGGCTQYGYDLVSPPEMVRHVTPDREAWASDGPVEYRLNAVDDRLVIRIYNHATEPIRLLGEQSVVVDPDRESHPLRGQIIAPDSFAKLILPPIRPRLEPTGPAITFGFGAGYGGRRGFYDPYWGGYYDAPSYRLVDGGNQYWSWDGEGDVRLRLSYQLGDRPPFVQQLVIHRRKLP